MTLEDFSIFTTKNKGIESIFLKNDSNPLVLEKFQELDKTKPISKVKLNQLFLLSKESGMTEGFFKYYWTSTPKHCYNISSIPHYDEKYDSLSEIESKEQLYWGFYRLYTDALLFKGNIRFFYRIFCKKDFDELERFFSSKKLYDDSVVGRGLAIPLNDIVKDDRYLISEMACKSYGETPETEGKLLEFLLASYQNFVKDGGKTIKIKDLLEGKFKKQTNDHLSLQFSADTILDDTVTSEEDIATKCQSLAKKFISAHKAA